MDYSIVLNMLNPGLLKAAEKILVVGSFSEGLQTSTSDIDLYILTKEGYVGAPFVNPQGAVHLGHPVEVSILTEEDLVRVYEMYCGDSYSKYDPRQLEKLHKIIQSDVIFSKENLTACEYKFETHVFERKMVQYYDAYVTDIYLDLIGAYNENDIYSAINFAEFMLDTAVDGWLAYNGDTYPKAKWRPKRLRKFESGIVDSVLAHNFDNPIGKVSEYERYLRSCLDLIAKIKLDIFRAGNSIPAFPKSASVYYAWCELSYVYSSNDQFYLQTTRRVLVLDKVSASLLYLVHLKLSASDMVHSVIHLLKALWQLSASVDQVESRLDSLIKAGVLKIAQ